MDIVYGETTPQRLIWQLPDGSIWYTSLTEPMRKGETEQEYLARMIDVIRASTIDLASAVALLPQHKDTLPSMPYQACWRYDGKTLAVDMGLAQSQRLNEIRVERDVRLAASDAIKARLDDMGNPLQNQAVKVYRQSLRDLPAGVTADLGALSTVEQLQKYQPAWPVANF